jgi:hypothetical protein
MQPSCITWVTALARCFGIELTSLGPLQSSTGYWPVRRLAFPMASPSLPQINGSYPTKFPSAPPCKRGILASPGCLQAGGGQPFLYVSSRLGLAG